MLSMHLRLGLPTVLVPSGFPIYNLYASLCVPIRATFPAHFIVVGFIIPILLGEE
jgi:hypothetical protein